MADDDATELKPEDQPVVELVFVGKRSEGWAWRDDTRVRIYGGANMRGRVPGGIYSIRARRDDGNLTVFPHTLTYTGRRSEDAAALQLREDAAELGRRVDRLHKGTSKTQDIDDAIAPLLELAKRMTYADRRALATYVAARIQS